MGGGGSVSKYAPRYFKIDWDKASKDWEYALYISDVDSPIKNSNLQLNIAASYKSVYEVQGYKYTIIASYPFINKKMAIGFSYIPLFVSQFVLDSFEIQGKSGIQTFEDIINLLSNIILLLFGVEVNLSMEGITEITEEEFYKID